MDFDCQSFLSGLSIAIGVFSIILTFLFRKESDLKEKIKSKQANIDKLRKEVMAYYLVEQQYMKHIADNEGLNPKGIQKKIRDAAQFADNNPDQLRPTMSYNEALSYTK